MDDRSPDGRAPSVVRIRAAAAWCRRKPWGAAGVAVALFALLSLSSGIYAVGNGETAALQRWGQVLDAAVEPGLRLSIPWGVDQVTRVRTGEVQRAADRRRLDQGAAADHGRRESHRDGGGRPVHDHRSRRLSSSAVDDPPAASSDRCCVPRWWRRSAPCRWTTCSPRARRRSRTAAHRGAGMLDRYGAGLTLLGVNLEWAKPPIEAAQAFRDVNDAKADAATARQQAQSARERTLSLARGEADPPHARRRAAAPRRGCSEAHGRHRALHDAPRAAAPGAGADGDRSLPAHRADACCRAPRSCCWRRTRRRASI